MALNAVVFPAPFGPMRPTSSPGCITRLKSESALRPPNRMVTPFTSRGARGHTAPFVESSRTSVGEAPAGPVAASCRVRNSRRTMARSQSSRVPKIP